MGQHYSRSAFYSLFLVLFIDGLGQGLLFPILAGAVLPAHSAYLLTASASLATRNLWYGIIIAAFGLLWFIGGPILSDFSDSKGRKFSLLLCLTGSAAGYLLSAVAFVMHSMSLMIIGRLIDGFTAGGQSIAQAAVIDMSDDRNRSHNLALILMSLTLGLIIGPVIGGYLASPDLVSWFSFTTPLYFAMGIALINLVLLWMFYPDAAPRRPEQQLSLLRSVTLFAPLFRHKNLRKVVGCYAFLQFGWALYYMYLTVYATRSYHLSAQHAGVLFSGLGLSLTLGFMILVKLLDGRAIKRTLILLGYAFVFMAS